MQLSYYPGCTLKTRARNFEDSAIAAMAVLGVDLVELSRWNCCGTVFSLAEDDIVHHVAPVRNLIRAREQGSEYLVTLCSFCYNTLKRADRLPEVFARTRVLRGGADQRVTGSHEIACERGTVER